MLESCQKGMKTYFLKATELNQKFTEARRRGREGAVINGLVKPSCLIIDEIGRCVFDRDNTQMFFDVSLTAGMPRMDLTPLSLQATNPHTSGKSSSVKMMICSVHWTGLSMMPQCSCSRGPVTAAGNWKQYRYRLVNLNR